VTNILFLSGIVGAGVSLIVTILLNSRRANRGSARSMSSSHPQEIEIWE